MSKRPLTAASPASPAAPGDRVRLTAEFERTQLLGLLFGEFDRNLVAIENRLGVYISARGNRVQIEGEAEAAARARDVLTDLYDRIEKGAGGRHWHGRRRDRDVGAADAGGHHPPR